MKAELFKELPSIRDMKNKIKFEAMLFAKDKKRDDQRGACLERASVGGRQQMPLGFSEPEKDQKKVLRKMGTLNLSDNDFASCENSVKKTTESPFRINYGQDVVAIEEYSDEEQTPLRKASKKKSKEIRAQFSKEPIDQPKLSPEYPGIKGFIRDRVSPRGDVYSTLSKDEFFNGAEVNSIIPKTKFDPNDSIIEELSRIGIKNRQLVKKGTFHDMASLEKDKKQGARQMTNHNSQSSIIQLEKMSEDDEPHKHKSGPESKKKGQEQILHNVLVDEFQGLLSDMDSISDDSKQGHKGQTKIIKPYQNGSLPQERPTTKVEIQVIEGHEVPNDYQNHKEVHSRPVTNTKLRDYSLQNIRQGFSEETLNFRHVSPDTNGRDNDGREGVLRRINSRQELPTSIRTINRHDMTYEDPE